MAGDYCDVLTSRQTGKSSLMHRTTARLRVARIAALDLIAIGQNRGQPSTSPERPNG